MAVMNAVGGGMAGGSHTQIAQKLANTNCLEFFHG